MRNNGGNFDRLKPLLLSRLFHTHPHKPTLPPPQFATASSPVKHPYSGHFPYSGPNIYSRSRLQISVKKKPLLVRPDGVRYSEVIM